MTHLVAVGFALARNKREAGSRTLLAGIFEQEHLLRKIEYLDYT